MPGHRVGLFGGTFDPPHVGHLSIVFAAHRALALSHVLMVVAGQPWQKADLTVSDAAARWEMVEAATAGIEWLEPCDVELQRPGPTYTIDTVEQLGQTNDWDELVLIMGADAAAGLGTWRRADELAAMVTIAVAERPGTVLPDLPGWGVERFDVEKSDVSSTEVRRRVAAGESLDALMPESVQAVIRRRGLYRLG